MRSLLIADDERTIREGIAGSVNWESLGISRVILAADGKEAYEIIKKENPDIAVIDIVMPEMTGIEVISRTRGESGGPEFVIISGYGEFDYAREALRHHVDNYILKPCGANEISTAIKKVISKLECQKSIQQERTSLREYIDLLLPQAKEQILRDLIIGRPDKGRELFRKVFDKSCEEVGLILFVTGSPCEYPKLPALKECVDTVLDGKGWSFSVILRDFVVLVYDDAEIDINNLINMVYNEGSRFLDNGVKAVVSRKGSIENLPDIYEEASEAVDLYISGTEQPTGGDNTEIIDISALRYSKPVRQAMQYVKANLSDSSLSLTHIASEVLFLNPNYLGKLFKKESGAKFTDYLMTVRMEKAKRLIESSCELKIYEIARQVGFGDNTAYFGQVFRKYSGLLPSEYKARYDK